MRSSRRAFRGPRFQQGYLGIGVRRALGGQNTGPSFTAPLQDAGAGAVNLVLTKGAGSATFTRATSATCWGPTGLLLTVGTGVARSTYSELTGALYLGYLCEEARTNTCIQNRDFTNVAWVMTTMTPLKDQVGIDGAANSASSLLATGANATAAQTVTIAAVNRPFSVYVKRLVGTGNIDLAQDGASFTTQSVANDGLYHRVTLVASQLNPVLTIRLATNGDKIAVDYAALEDSAGAARVFPTSPIATTTVAVTRNADSLNYQAAGNVNNATGSAYAEITASPLSSGAASATVIGTDTGINGRALMRQGAGATTTIVSADGTNTTTKSAITDYSLGVPVKVAASWTGITELVTGSGLAAQSGVFDGTMGDGSTLTIGRTGAGSQFWGGTIKNVQMWGRALSSAEMQTVTT